MRARTQEGRTDVRLVEEKENGLVDLEAKDLGLNEAERSAVDLDQALALLNFENKRVRSAVRDEVGRKIRGMEIMVYLAVGDG